MNARASRHHRPLRPLVVGLGLCLVLFCLYFVTYEPHDAVAWKQQLQQDRQKEDHQQKQQQKAQHQTQHRPAPAILRSLSLTEKHCQVEFPGLTQSIDEIVAEGPFRLKNTGDMGALQGRIKNGKVSLEGWCRKDRRGKKTSNFRNRSLSSTHNDVLTCRNKC